MKARMEIPKEIKQDLNEVGVPKGEEEVIVRDVMSIIEHPLLAGISRKSMIYKTLDVTADQALNGTTALHMACLQKGAKILRVHDVKEAVECTKLYEQLNA